MRLTASRHDEFVLAREVVPADGAPADDVSDAGETADRPLGVEPARRCARDRGAAVGAFGDHLGEERPHRFTALRRQMPQQLLMVGIRTHVR